VQIDAATTETLAPATVPVWLGKPGAITQCGNTKKANAAETCSTDLDPR